MTSKILLGGGALVGLAATAIMQFSFNSAAAYKDIVEFVSLLAGLIATSLIMRSDVKALKAWAWGEDGMARQMAQLRESNASLTQLAQNSERRLARIESHEDEQRPNR